ncbi:hypothetical protein EQT97_03645 [Fructilactobacillus sanfranciscensis]|nr:hypothetical protein [Fructilactobacillus sanfranciscensis]
MTTRFWNDKIVAPSRSLMDCVVTPLKTLMGFSVHLNVQLKFYNLPYTKSDQIHRDLVAFVMLI